MSIRPGNIIKENQFTGEVIGDMHVANYSERHDAWYVVVITEEDERTVRLATRKQLMDGNTPSKVIKRLKGNPYIHYDGGVTALVDVNGVIIIIDRDEFEHVRDITWRAHYDYRRGREATYVYGGIWHADTRYWEHKALHRYIMERHGIISEQYDHINRNTLDNRKENLRVADNRINTANRGLFKNNKSGYTGVRRLGNRYAARITVDGVEMHLGCKDTAEEAYKLRLYAENAFYAERNTKKV